MLSVWLHCLAGGVCMQQAFSDGKRHFQEGLPSGPSAFLQEHVRHCLRYEAEGAPFSHCHMNGHNVLEHTCCSSVLLGNIQTFQGRSVKTIVVPPIYCVEVIDTESLIGTHIY